MSFGVDYSKANTFELIPEGEYEAIISDAHVTQSKAGTPCISIPLTIRNDVDQPSQNRILYHNMWKRREPTAEDLSVDGYSFKQIQSLSKAAGLADGKKYASLDEWAADLENRTIHITVNHEDWQNRTSAKVGYIDPPKTRDCKHVWKEKPQEAPASFADDDEDDLPF